MKKKTSTPSSKSKMTVSNITYINSVKNVVIIICHTHRTVQLLSVDMLLMHLYKQIHITMCRYKVVMLTVANLVI